MDELEAISPLDGRYHKHVQYLSKYFSEFALIKKRVYVELMYLVELGKAGPDILKIHDTFSLNEAKKVKTIEHKTNHDVKAVEIYLRERLPEVKEYVHIGLTSEDVNNLSYSLLIKGCLEEFDSIINQLLDIILSISISHKNLVMLARTHGQPASPTTMGKEFLVYHNRLKNQVYILSKVNITGKLNGASGNYNALCLYDPNKDWIEFSAEFVRKLGLQPNLVTTQVEPRDSLVELLHSIKRINNILLDLNVDMWMYTAFGYFKLKKRDDEVGSSTMPQKVNPIDFENSEGNIKIANSVISGLESLQQSRLQRDLSDSTKLRNLGLVFGHSVLAYKSTMQGLAKLIPDHNLIYDDLQNHAEVLMEGAQIILRKHDVQNAYDILKKKSRGKVLTLTQFYRIIDELDIDSELKAQLKRLKPDNYIGLATEFSKDK